VNAFFSFYYRHWNRIRTTTFAITIRMTLTEESTQTDILILGATGFTGKLITRYLSTHPQRTQFTLVIGGRSIVKLEELARNLNLNPDLHNQDGVGIVQVDLKDESALERIVKSARVIINAIGPYFLSGTPIVRLCARNGVHYLDLSGETHWHQHLIKAHDYTASRSGAIIVPSCAFNAVPADICVYLAAKGLRGISPPLLPGKSTTVYDRKGGYSGGTAATTISTFGGVDHEVLQRSMEPYTLSPVVGKQPNIGFEFVSRLTMPKQFGGQTFNGSFSTMASINTAVVQRTFGQFEVYHEEHGKIHLSAFINSNHTLVICRKRQRASDPLWSRPHILGISPRSQPTHRLPLLRLLGIRIRLSAFQTS
jgi:short subunit dehydrogenase-like uncharacterized protein